MNTGALMTQSATALDEILTLRSTNNDLDRVISDIAEELGCLPDNE